MRRVHLVVHPLVYKYLSMSKLNITLLAALLSVACGKPGTEGGGGGEPATLTAPTNLQLKSATDNSLTFQWDQVQGATSYEWKLTLEGTALKSGTAKERHTEVDGLTAGTGYGFSVCAKNASQTSAWSAVCQASTTGKAPGPEDLAVCVDAPLVVEVGTGATLGTSGLIRVYKADGTLVDKIDMADMAKMTALSDGTLVPKEQMNQETTYHTFLDALHSTRYRPVHYTPVRLNGGKLEIKLHNEALTFGTSYYVTMDASVAGKALAKDDMPFSTKSKPSGNTLKVAAEGSMYLARSGGGSEYDNVTYVNCTMSSVIAPVGWFSNPAPTPSAPTATAGWKEYGTTGVSTAQRNAYGKILTSDEATAYSSKAAVLGW